MIQRWKQRILIFFATTAALGLLPGCFGLFKRGDARAPTNNSTLSQFVQTIAGEEQTNISRSSGLATFARLQALFPDIANYVAKSEFGPEPTDGTNQSLGLKVRAISAQAQYTLRKYTTSLCANVTATSPMFQTAPELLMAGESYPDDAALKAGLVAARAGWLFPYKTDSAEVKALAGIYSTLAYDINGQFLADQDQPARQAMCIAVLTAPNFWIGNQSPNDVIRRIALELVRRAPTFAEYSDYINKRMTLQDYGRKLQKEPGYILAVHDWHKNWLSFYWQNEIAQEERPSMALQGNYLGHQAAYVFKFNPTAYTSDQFSGPSQYHTGPTLKDALVRYEGETGNTHPLVPYAGQPSESNRVGIAATLGDYIKYGPDNGYNTETTFPAACDITKDQPFDPRTTGLIWEQRNPLNGIWETIGSWQRLKNASGNWTEQWQMVNGQITTALNAGAVPTQVVTTLKDLVYASTVDFKNSADPYAYQVVDPGTDQSYTSKLIGTPMNPFYTRDRRVRRIAVSGEQDGVSIIQFPRTGAKARICNSMDRYYATCAFRPNSRVAADFNMGYDPGHWNPTTGKIMLTYSQPQPRYAIMTPSSLSAMKCGLPNMNAMSSLGSASQYAHPQDDPNENTAWPFGYTPSLNQPLSDLSATLNPVAHYLSIAAFYPVNMDAWETADYDFPEVKAELIMKRDIAQEPYRLLDDILNNGKDYRLLVTANYTFGGDYYEYMLREQGYFLPGGPQLAGGSAYIPSADLAQAAVPHRIDFSNFPPIPIKALESVDGNHSFNDARTMADLVAIGEIRPKFHAGILNMPTFLSQYTPGSNIGALGLRTMADRYFARLMCGNAALFTPTEAQAAIHRPFVPNIEAAAKDHLDPAKGCYQCHINMDPLASALSANFSASVNSQAIGELRIMDDGQYYQGPIYGIRGGGPPSRGAFLGQPVNGLADVSQVLANSTQFNSCVIQKAMEELYGRDPVFADLNSFNIVLGKFMKSHNYNQMIIDLISMPSFTRGD